MGKTLSFLVDISINLKCRIISYDYSGYGCSKGKSSEEEIYDDMNTIIGFVRDKLQIQKNIYL